MRSLLKLALAGLWIILAPPVAAQSHHAAADHAGQHGMFMMGHDTLFLSHMPMFTTDKHMYQVVLRASLPAEIMAEYQALRRANPDKPYNLINISGNSFTLPQIKSGEVTSYNVTVFDGYSNAGGGTPGPVLWDKVALKIEEVVLFRHFNFSISRPDTLNYTVFGRGDEAHMTHYIARDPSFQHIISLAEPPEWLSEAQLRSGTELNFADLPSEPIGCKSPLTLDQYKVRLQGRQDLVETLNMGGSQELWYSTGNLLNAADPCAP